MPMAASSILSASVPFNNRYRMSQVGVSICSSPWHKGITSFSFHFHSWNFSTKLYTALGRSISHRVVVKPVTATQSLEVEGKTHGNQVPTNIFGPKDPQRSKTLLDVSARNTLDHVNDLALELEELLDEVRRMTMRGMKSDAIDLLQANYEAVKEQMDAGSRGIEEAATLDVIALGYMIIGNLKIVESLLEMLNKAVDSLKDNEPFLDSILAHMGSMHAAVGKYEKSVLLYKRVLKIRESEYGSNSTFLIVPLLGIAKVLSSNGRASKATESYHRAITILESNKGVESEDLVVPLNALGNLLIKEGRAVDAENLFSRIVNIYVEKYGENDGRVGLAMCSLAHVKCAKGDIDEAIDLYRNAIGIIKGSNYIMEDDDTLEKMRVDLAELLHSVGRGEEGRTLLKECLFISEKHKGKEHPDSVMHLVNLATSYSQAKNFVEAERLLRTSLQVMMKTVHPNDPSHTFPMLHLAVTLYNLNQTEEAEQLALEVLRIREMAFGKESLPVGEALDCLVSIQTRLEKDDNEVLELLKRVLSIQEQSFGYESEEVMETIKKILFCLDKLGMKDEKFPLQKRLSMLKKKYKRLVRW